MQCRVGIAIERMQAVVIYPYTLDVCRGEAVTAEAPAYDHCPRFPRHARQRSRHDDEG
jgi:hypothetical protein